MTAGTGRPTRSRLALASLIAAGGIVAFTTTTPPPPPPPPMTFFARANEGNMDIYSLNSRTGVETRLTNHPAEDSHPSVLYRAESPLAFHSYRDGDFQVYVMNADGSQQTRLTATPASDQAPLWSAEGRITFTSDREDRALFHERRRHQAGVHRHRAVMGAPGGKPAASCGPVCIRQSVERLI